MQRNKGKRQGTIESRVARGAKWLDRVKPDWYTLIDLDNLMLESGCDCVLGQIVRVEGRRNNPNGVEVHGYGTLVVSEMQNIEVRKERLSTVDKLADLVMPVVTARRRGFHLTNFQSFDEWNNLTEEWKRVILERRHAA